MKIHRHVLCSASGFLLPLACLGVWLGSSRIPLIKGFPPTPGWRQFGGAWQLENGTMRNNSTERGAKLLTGSYRWKNYRVEADVALLGANGDSGLIVRAQEIARGVDSYKGFFAGLRTLDDTIILGQADYGWKEYAAKPVPVYLELRHFYHLEVVAVDCKIAAVATLADGLKVREGIELTRCPERGLVGLKSYQTPAQWKNFRVSPADESDVQRVMAGQPLQSSKLKTLHQGASGLNLRLAFRDKSISHQLEGPTTPIGQLALQPLVRPKIVSIRGVVRLLSPLVVVEDLTGGLTLASSDAVALAIGDEVQVTGEVLRSGSHLVIQEGHVQSLWSNDPVAPAMVSSAEAATGEHDDRLVVINGTLIRRWVDKQQTTVLEIRSGGEVFRALMDRTPFAAKTPDLPVLSELQLMGVVRSDPKYADETAFAILLAPTDSAVRLLHEAPWWNVKHVLFSGLALICLSGICLYTYALLKERYLLSIVDERERLAHDLHDTVAQSFAGIGFQLSGVKQQLDAASTSSALVDRAQNMVKESHEELRRSITTLRYDTAGLNDIAGALDSVARRLVGAAALEITSTTHGTRRRLPLSVADCLFRVGQEAITNALLHAKANKLQIVMNYGSERVQLLIKDDGCGLPPGHETKGNGLFGMHRRAARAGVRLAVNQEEVGTTIALDADLPKAASILTRLLQQRTYP